MTAPAAVRLRVCSRVVVGERLLEVGDVIDYTPSDGGLFVAARVNATPGQIAGLLDSRHAEPVAVSAEAARAALTPIPVQQSTGAKFLRILR